MYPRALNLFFCESPHIGHLKFARYGDEDFNLNYETRLEINPAYFVSIRKVIRYYTYVTTQSQQFYTPALPVTTNKVKITALIVKRISQFKTRQLSI